MFSGVKIVFGMDLDGASWSKNSSVGEYTCGPMGMLKFLETRLGLTGVETSDIERIDAYARKMDSAHCEWCRKSFSTDRWSTAATMLAWRDELVALGRRLEDADLPVRFDALAKIENAATKLPPGLIDRLVQIKNVAKRKLDVDLSLIDDYEDFPLIWREVIKACFSNWKSIQNERAEQLPKITVIKGVNEIALARDVARYLSIGGDERVAVVSEFDTQVLDAEMHRFGLASFGVSDPSRERKAIQRLIDAISEYGRIRETDDYDVKDLLAVLKNVSDELKKDIDRNPISKLASSYVSQVKDKLVGQKAIRRSALLRLMQMVIGQGARCPYSSHELGSASFLRSPGELQESVDVALWTPFVPAGGRAGMIFREEEKKFVGEATAGVSLVDDERSRANRRESRSLARFVSQVRGELVLLIPDRISGEAAGVHPLYDVLLKRLGKEAKDLEKRDGDLIVKGVWSLAERSVALKDAKAFRPKFSDVFTVEKDEKLAPKSLSPTQLESLLSCPFQWYHKYYLGLAASDAAKNETTKTRQGNMAHLMVQRLVESKVVDSAGIDANFDGIFESNCNDEIPEFAEPERKLERDNFKALLLESVKALWSIMKDRGLTPVASEYKFPEKDFRGVPFSGNSDLILQDADGRRYIFDFKWSTRKDYAEKIKDGTSVQLAAYDWLGGFGARSAYYLFPDRKFIENTQDDADVWQRVEKTYDKRLEIMRSGVMPKAIDIGLEGYVSASKLEMRRQAVGDQGLSIDIHAGCRYCDFKALCGKLWEEGGAK